MNRALDRERGRIAAAYEKRVRVACDGEYPDVLQLKGRLDPTRWVLEWSFGRWVGTALGVEDPIRQRITLSNVLILASVVWQDDLADGELVLANPVGAQDIGETLFDAAMEPYRELLPGDSLFWPAVEQWMGIWRAATIRAAERETGADLRKRPFEPSALAVRGTPLKIPALGLCLLAKRQDAFPAIEACIDHAVTGLVLYDHFVDWREDMAGSRWNAFVESAIAARPVRPGAPAPADVEAVMLTQPVVTSFFALIDRELRAGEQLAAGVGVVDLALHLHGLAGELRDEGQSISTRYAALGERAHQLIFERQAVTA